MSPSSILATCRCSSQSNVSVPGAHRELSCGSVTSQLWSYAYEQRLHSGYSTPMATSEDIACFCNTVVCIASLLSSLHRSGAASACARLASVSLLSGSVVCWWCGGANDTALQVRDAGAAAPEPYVTRARKTTTARAENRRFGLLGTLRPHTKLIYLQSRFTMENVKGA